MSIQASTVDGVARIGIARPEKKNALTQAMYQGMADALNSAQADAKVRAVLLHGTPEIFTAGNDLEDFLHRVADIKDAPVRRFMMALLGVEKPVVVAVNGAAIGIGTTLLQHCDLVYCADNAVFSMPFVNLGLCPEFASSLLLPQIAGHRKAAEKLLLGDPITPQEAVEMGLVNRILPPVEVMDFALRQALRFNKLPAEAVRRSKALMRTGSRELILKTLDEENRHFAELLQQPAAKEAFSAFLEKRKPDLAKFAG